MNDVFVKELCGYLVVCDRPALSMGSWFSDAFAMQINILDTDIGSRPDVTNTTECVVKLLRQYRGRIVVVTGAGISSHQLPTFRSDNNSGLWEAFGKPALDKISFYQCPDPCWKLLANVRNMQKQKSLYPSLAHHVIHELLKRKYVSRIITQNIDGLHSFPGDADKVIELHGSVSDYGICEHCQQRRKVDCLKILEIKGSPVCEECGKVLKPSVAFFGDVIEHDKRTAAYTALSQCDILILVGTHCTVDPVLSMASEARRRGCVIIEINLAATPATGFVDISLQGKADDVLGDIAKQIMSDIDWDNLCVDGRTPF